MSNDQLAAIIHQEQTLILPAFDEAIAFDIGTRIRAKAAAIQAPIAIVISAPNRRYFFTCLAGATPENEDWARRKMNVVFTTYKSSLRLGLEYKAGGLDQWPEMNLPYADFALHGGAFPLRVKDSGLVGAIGFSGLPSIEDHLLITDTLAEVLGIDPLPLPQ